MNTEEKLLREKVMHVISGGGAHMRPRWHFLLFSALWILGGCIVLLALLYSASLLFFSLRESGAWFAPSFGMRGWQALFHSIPWLLVAFLIVFVLLLEYVIKQYRFVYRKPLLLSVGTILFIIIAGGFALARTPFHRGMLESARHGQLPPPFGMWYGGMHPPHGEVYHGRIVGLEGEGFLLVDIDGVTSTVLVSRGTRLPYGADFSEGDYVIVIGDEMSTDTVKAFGIREVDE